MANLSVFSLATATVLVSFLIPTLSMQPAMAATLLPLFRSGSGDQGTGPQRTVSISAPAGWRQVSPINQDPLSLAQWTPSELKCSTGAPSRISLYAVDVGLAGPHKLLQHWVPDALTFNVAEPERGFVIVRANAEPNHPQTVIAYPLSDSHITSLAGWIGDVNVVLVAESTTLSSEQLESVVRQTLRNQVAVKTNQSKSIDVAFVLFSKQWHKALGDRLELAVKKGEPNAIVSRAYSMFNDADGFVPAGQLLLLQAADKGHALAKLDLIRLSRRSLLTVQISSEKLAAWSKELADAGSDDARFWETEQRPFDDVDANIPGLEKLKKLSACGQPEARRTWAKHLVQSFKASERYVGRNIVMSLMRQPPLEGTLPITTRVPRAVDAPAIEQLKVAALLKTACPNEEDPEQDLFAHGDDFKIAKKLSSKSTESDSDKEDDEFPELKEARRLDKMVNSGNMKTLKEAQKLACNWSGSDSDRDRIVVEIAARQNDAYGKWRRFRACDVIQEHNMASFCREKEMKQARINGEAKYRDILVAAAPELRNAIAALRAKATAFHEALLKKSYENAESVREKSDLDRMRRQLELESLNLVAATLNQNLQNEIKDVITGRRLLLLPPTKEEANFTLLRQPASALFMKKELGRLETRMDETLKSIAEADKVDISKDFKKGATEAHEAWKAYRQSYAAFLSKLAEQGVNTEKTQAAADLWFHIEGIYYFEQVRDHELNRVPMNTDVG